MIKNQLILTAKPWEAYRTCPVHLQQARAPGGQLQNLNWTPVRDQPAQADPEPAWTWEGTVRPVQGNPNQGNYINSTHTVL